MSDERIEIQQPEWTEQDIRERQRALAAMKKLTVDEAYAAIDLGEFNGTIFASEMSMLRFLLGE